jgi:hypothetical protein
LRLIMTRKLLLLAFLFIFALSNAQNNSIGTWQMHLPLNASNSIAVSSDYVYSSTGSSILKYNRSDESVEIFDKTNGLNELLITKIAYDKTTKSLVILYTNSVIDILDEKENSIYSINDIKNKTVAGDKTLNDVYFNNGLAYISTGFSVQVLDLIKKEFKEAYYIGNTGGNILCLDFTIYNNTFYAATQSGLKSISINNPGILNYVNWQNISTSGAIPNQVPQKLEIFNNKLYLILSDTLYTYDGTSWSKIGAEKYWTTKDMTSTDSELLLTQWRDSSTIISDKRILKYNTSMTASSYSLNTMFRPLQAISLGADDYFIADLWRGLTKVKSSNISLVNLNSPDTKNAFAISIQNSNLYVANGSYDGSVNYTFTLGGYAIFIDRWWNNFNVYNTPVLADVYDIVSVTPDEKSKKIYCSSLFSGLIVIDENNGNVLYNKDNSILEYALGDARSRVTDTKIDKEGNVFILNNSAPNPIKAIDKNGNWHTINGVPGVLGLKKMIVDQYGQLWITVRGSTSLMVVDKGDITTPTDDKAIAFTTSVGSGALPSEFINDLVEDLEGDIWLATAAGIGVFYCSSSVLSSSNRCDAQKILVQRDGYNEYLFEKQLVRAIAIDGANRKWVGTTSGLWLISADGKDEILNFNASNSPLPSSDIYDIAVDDKTGIVYIATEGGLVSYQGDATLGGEEHTDVLVYPNPVRPDYTGPIAVKGLVNDANIKITDVSGGLIWQGKANGGQAIWDGKNYNGEKAKTGIYLVYSLSNDGKEHYCAKIAFIN